MATRPATVAEYLAALPEDRRAALEDLRRTVAAAAPDAVECIAYDMPAYRLDGRFMCSFGAYKRHYSLFPASQAVLDTLGDEAAAYARGKGTFQFPAKDPLPLDLIAQIVRIRREETAAAGR
jgi:uncharacterized protein YdhG (YjbR/CyaY superfamily)